MNAKTQVLMEGYFSEKVCERIKEIMSGMTYYDFIIDYSNQAGNCTLIVATNREGTTKEELKEMFVYCCINELADCFL